MSPHGVVLAILSVIDPNKSWKFRNKTWYGNCVKEGNYRVPICSCCTWVEFGEPSSRSFFSFSSPLGYADTPEVLFAVSKKHIPKAVERNKIKRQMHAIYFNNLELFLEGSKKAIALTYVSKSPTSFLDIKKSMTTLFSLI